MKTPIEQLEHFLANPPEGLSTRSVQLSIFLARLKHWMNFFVWTKEQQDVFLIDFPHREEMVQALELRLCRIGCDISDAVYSALGAQSTVQVREQFLFAGIILRRCVVWEGDVRALLKNCYEFEMEGAYLEGQSEYAAAAVTRQIVPSARP